MDNKKLLKLEGHDLCYGWHAYFIYDKSKNDNFFTCHIIRKALYNIWKKHKRKYGDKRPSWVIPMEVLKQKVDYGDELRLRYEDLVEW